MSSKSRERRRNGGLGKLASLSTGPPAEEITVTTEAKDAFAKIFEGVGGLASAIAWARQHKTQFYQIYAKLIPLQVAAQVAVNVEVDAEQARAKLLDMFDRIRAARQEEAARTGSLVIDGVKYTRAIEPPESVREPVDVTPAAPTEAAPANVVRIHPEVTPKQVLPREAPTAPPQPNSTQLYYEWMNNGGAERWWGPIGSGGGPP